MRLAKLPLGICRCVLAGEVVAGVVFRGCDYDVHGALMDTVET